MTYAKALQLERYRERNWRKTRQGAFESSFLHFGSESSISEPYVSDNGAGVKDIIAHCDGEDTMSRYQRMLKRAREKVRYADPKLLEVFALVVKNGKNRKESIWELAKTSRMNGKPPKSATGET